METFLIYQGKVAIALAVFYMFYRLLLSKDTFHRFNRIVLIGTSALSFILPLCIITVRKTVTIPAPVQQSFDFPISAGGTAMPTIEATTPWWPAALCALFATGAICILIHTLVSIIKIRQIIRGGECIEIEGGEKIIVTETDTAPFSWMKYIVISRADYEGGYTQILTHEKAHIALRHSFDILFVDMITCFQWFNPAIWMLKSDLRAIHEFEADDAVLRSGANVKEYQYLLIRKAVGKSGYSVANSFNHSTLKQRITMMSNKKSSRMSAWKALYIIPLVGISLAATAETKLDYRYAEPESQPDTTARKVTQVNADTQEGTEENVITIGNSAAIKYRGEIIGRPLIVVDGEPMPEDFDLGSIEESKIETIKVLKDEEAIDKYDLHDWPDAANGVVEIWLKWEREYNPDEPVRFIPVSEPVGDVKEYNGFKLYDSKHWNEKISYKEYKLMDSDQIAYLFVENWGSRKWLHIYTLDYNTGIHLSKCKKTKDYNDEALDWVNEKTQIIIDGKWENYEGYLRKKKFKMDEVKEIEYYKYPESKMKKHNLANNGYVNVIFKTEYDNKITLTM